MNELHASFNEIIHCRQGKILNLLYPQTVEFVVVNPIELQLSQETGETCGLVVGLLRQGVGEKKK